MNLLKIESEMKEEREKDRREQMISTGMGMVEQCTRKLKDLDPKNLNHHPYIMHYGAEMRYWGTVAEKWMNHVDHKG